MSNGMARINVDGNPFHYREHSQGDLGVIQQIFAQRDYDLDAHGAQSARLRRWERSRAEPLAIIDAGANIGASAVWFRTQVPCSRVIAIEPEAHNCTLLKRNVAHLTGVEPLLAALGASSGAGEVVDPGRGDWGFQVKHGPGNALINMDKLVSIVSVPEVLAHDTLRGTVPYILKVDIEGGEEELFSGDCEWLARFPLTIIELHDWLVVGRSTSRNFLRCVAGGSFDVCLRGENLWVFNNTILGSP